MYRTTRRHALLSGALILLGGCGADGKLNTAGIAMVAGDVSAIATAFSNSLTAIAATPGVRISADALTKAQLALTGIRGAAQALQGVTDATAAQPVVQQVETYVQAFVGAISTVPILPPQVQTYLQVANILLPVVFAAVNLAVPPPPVSPAVVPAAPAMTPEQARQAATTG